MDLFLSLIAEIYFFGTILPIVESGSYKLIHLLYSPL
jgi:hypothetical protein